MNAAHDDDVIAPRAGLKAKVTQLLKRWEDKARDLETMTHNLTALKLKVLDVHEDVIADGEVSEKQEDATAVVNVDNNRVHIATVHGASIHPSEWRTRCAWPFGHKVHVTMPALHAPPRKRCKRCWDMYI